MKAAYIGVIVWDSGVPDGAVKVTVRNGWLTLTGTVAQQSERLAAEFAVKRLHGVSGVVNSIDLQFTPPGYGRN